MSRGAGVPNSERCNAMSKTGQRCIFRKVTDTLCALHERTGSIQPDEWTEPDNLPVFYVKDPLPARGEWVEVAHPDGPGFENGWRNARPT